MSFWNRSRPYFFPPRCAFCGKPGVHGVCSECEKALPYCKTPLHERAEIGACLAPLKYEGIVREALLKLQIPREPEPLHGLWRCFSAGRCRAFRRRVRFGYLCPRVEKAQTRARLRSVVSLGARDLPPLERRTRKRCCKRRRTTSRSRRFRPVRSGRKTSSAHTLPSMRTRSRVSAFCSSTISSPPAPRCAKPREFYGKLARKKSSAPPSPRRTKTKVFKKRGDASFLRKFRCASCLTGSTRAPRKVFLPTYTPRVKTIQMFRVCGRENQRRRGMFFLIFP